MLIHGSTNRVNAASHMVNVLLRTQLLQNRLILNLTMLKSKTFQNGQMRWFSSKNAEKHVQSLWRKRTFKKQLNTESRDIATISGESWSICLEFSKVAIMKFWKILKNNAILIEKGFQQRWFSNGCSVE